MNGDIEIIERRPERMFGRDLYVTRYDRMNGKRYVLQPQQAGDDIVQQWVEMQADLKYPPTVHLQDDAYDALVEHFQETHPVEPPENVLRHAVAARDDAIEVRDRLPVLVEQVVVSRRDYPRDQ